MGVTMVLSTSYLYSQERYADGTYFFRKQLIAMGGGIVALVVCSMCRRIYIAALPIRSWRSLLSF